MFDPGAAFEAWFKRVEDGYIFYPHRFARGISVTEAEHDRMIAAHESLNRDKPMATIVVMVIAVLVASVVGGTVLFANSIPLLPVIIVLIGVGSVLGLLWLRGRSIREPIRGRKPDRPRRSQREFDEALGGANGRFYLSMGCLWLAVSAFAAFSLGTFATPMNWLFFALAVANAVLNFWTYFSGRRAIRDEQS